MVDAVWDGQADKGLDKNRQVNSPAYFISHRLRTSKAGTESLKTTVMIPVFSVFSLFHSQRPRLLAQTIGYHLLLQWHFLHADWPSNL